MKAKSFIILLFNKNAWKTIWELIFIWYIKKYRKYYTHIDYLPLFNFAEILKGKFEYLYHNPGNKRVPRIYFANIFQEMNFQFHTLDNSMLRDKADLADYDSKSVRSKSKKEKDRWLNQYNTLKKKIDSEVSKPFDLDSFTDYIEHTYNFAPGSIDVKKISTAKAFSNYQKAINYNKRKK